MYTLTIRPEDAKYFMEAQEKLGSLALPEYGGEQTKGFSMLRRPSGISGTKTPKPGGIIAILEVRRFPPVSPANEL